MAINTAFVNPLIEKHKEAAYLITETTTGGDDWNPTVTTTEDEVDFVPTTWESMYKSESYVEMGDVFGIISTRTGAVPQMDKNIRIGGEVYQMVNVMPVRYRGSAVIYKIQARK